MLPFSGCAMPGPLVAHPASPPALTAPGRTATLCRCTSPTLSCKTADKQRGLVAPFGCVLIPEARLLHLRGHAMKVLHDKAQTRPHIRRWVRTEQAKLEDQLYLIFYIIIQSWVNSIDDGTTLPCVKHPTCQIKRLPIGSVHPDWSSCTGNLHHQHAKCKDVSCFGCLVKLSHLGGNVTPCTCHTGCVSVSSMIAEITKPCIHLTVKEDIAGFDVPMDDNLIPVLMEVEKGGCNTFDDVEPLRPA
ncbi:hypothetical protein U9M48_036982 [Paspalum notatum var. saurae]|uniref:Uncharacterized protein n=1 Tax=Paspalum notatum var. saurae TaxID=547442 RepID=A0AAQ3XBX3_PASNO